MLSSPCRVCLVSLRRLRTDRRHDLRHPRVVETRRELTARGPADGDGDEGGLARYRVARHGHGVAVGPVDHVSEVVGVKAAEGVEVVFDAIFDEVGGDVDEVVRHCPEGTGKGGGESGRGGFDGDVAVSCIPVRSLVNFRFSERIEGVRNESPGVWETDRSVSGRANRIRPYRLSCTGSE